MYYLYSKGYIYQTDFLFGNILIVAKDCSASFSSINQAHEALTTIENVLISNRPGCYDKEQLEHLLPDLVILPQSDLRILNAKNYNVINNNG